MGAGGCSWGAGSDGTPGEDGDVCLCSGSQREFILVDLRVDVWSAMHTNTIW